MRLKWGNLLSLGLVCGTLLICCVSAELLLRWRKRCYPIRAGWVGQYQSRYSPNFINDPQTGWRMRPNRSFVWTFDHRTERYAANSQGFRSDSDFSPRDPRYKMAFVGDSFTFGTGVPYEDTFPAIAAGHASDRVSWNFGMPGFGVDQAWLSARYQALPLKPDLVVAGLIDADFPRSQTPYRRFESLAKPAFKLVDNHLVQRQAESPNFLMRYLDQSSHLWSAYVRADQTAGIRYGVGNLWTLNRAIIDALREDCRKANVPVLFVYIPVKGFRPFPALRNYLRQTSASYIDLTEQRPKPPRSIYLKTDMHLSAEGNRYVADLIEQWLKTHRTLTAGVHAIAK